MQALAWRNAMHRDMHLGMRATVTIGDELFAAADDLAGEMGISRSRLYQIALREYLRSHRERLLTDRVNEEIAKYGQPIDERFSSYVSEVWAADMGDDEW